MSPSILSEISNPKSRVFRRLFIKRRLASTGLFESSWQDVTKDVKGWGRISKSIDYIRYSQVRFSDVNLTMANDYGRYNPEDDDGSLWFGYASQQRSLVKIEAGFIHSTQSASGIWNVTEFPTNPVVFIGVIQGDLSLSEDNQVNITVKPLLQVFRDFATRNLTGYTTTGGLTGNQFITLLRDQTDGSANFIFRPFFQDTTTYWNYTSSSIKYPDISNTIASARPIPAGLATPQNDFYEMNVWDALQKLGEAENLVPYITRDGTFTFSHRNANTTAAAFQFYGRGFQDFTYGTTIKRINRYVKKLSEFYSRVEVKWLDYATTTAIISTETAFAVTGSNTAWLYGHRTFQIENYWLATVTSANALAASVFATVSSPQNEIDFSTSFVPHLELLDRIQVSYDSTERSVYNRWDFADWAYDETTSASELRWANPATDALRFNAKEFKITSIELNLDTFESRFVGIAL